MGKRRYDPHKVSKALGLRVRELRNKKGWTLEECEEHGWLNWRHLQAIESGKNITIHTLVNLANLFGVSPSTILEGL
jgi:transcriptional regulator with XRE-family HTH domain